MVDFNSDIPKGRPTIDPEFLRKTKKDDDQNSIVSVNTDFTMKKLADISVFGKDKK